MERLKLIFICLIATVWVASCEKSDTGSGIDNNVPEQQNAVLFYFSGNWCGPCGLYGRPALKNIAEEFKGRVSIIDCQLNGSGKDPLNNAYATTMAGVFNVQAVPTAFIGANKGMKVVSGNSDMETQIRDALNDNISPNSIANTVITSQVEGSEVYVNVKTRFFQETSDKFELAVYLLESNIVERQYVSSNGWDDNSIFNNVLREVLSEMDGQLGENLVTGSVKNEEITKSFKVTLNPAWKRENLSVAAIIWVKNLNNTYSIVNGSSVKL
jgi:thiol-disulfide isomerase/thioredoxin